jgi:nicotinate-nucleotide adenylyltransferase
MTSPHRVALYGGSFNPPHVGHQLTVTLALCAGRFDAVHVLPVADHAFGKALLPLATRVRLLEAAFGAFGPRVVVNPVEASLPAPSYTVNTVAHLLAEHPDWELTLIQGADTWRERHRWHDWPRLEALLGGRLMVFGREGVEAPDAPVAFALPAIASSEIRRRRAAGEPWWWMVPDGVERLMLAEGLYA